MKKHLLLAAFTCALTPLAHAAEYINLDEVVVTATRIEQPLKQTLSSTTVITQEDIKNSQAHDLVTILRGVAGVEFSQNGGIGKATSLFLRGSNSNQVLVLVDGVRINSATTGTASIQDLMLDQIERIEIVRGNVSSVYGSDAIGGVVQIFTKKGRGAPRGNVSVGVGNLGTKRLAAELGGSVDNTDFHLQVSSFNTDGVSALNPTLQPKANPDADGYRNTSVSANIRHNFNADHSVSANTLNIMGYNQYDNAFGTVTQINNNTLKLSKIAFATDDKFTDSWNSHLQYAQGVDEGRDFRNGLPSTLSLFKTTNQQLTWDNTLLFSSTGKLLLGAEHLGQKVDSDAVYTINQRTVNSLYAGHTGNYGSHQVQTNLRQDNNSQYGAQRTGLLGYGFAFNESWRASANYSTAFRAPTFNELYYPGFGNSLINPEHSKNREAGIHYGANAQQLDLVSFDNRTRNLIVYAPGPVNINQARIDGVELSYAGQFGDTGLKGSFTSQDPRDETTGKALVRRAKTHGSMSLSQKIGAWQLGGQWLNSGERTDSGQILASYDVFNLTAAYALNKETKLALRAENITNQNDSTVYGFNPLGRTLYVNMSYQQ